MVASVELSQFIGRLHVVLLHLPIGFLVLLGILELISMVPRWRHSTLSNRFVLWLTVPVAVLTALCGWLLAESGGYDKHLLLLHRWTGISVALASCILLWLHSRGWLGAYRIMILATMALTIYTGHLGGSLTHGKDFLTRYAPDIFKQGGVYGWSETGSDKRFGPESNFGAAQTVLNHYCVSCHGPDKSKGGLRLDSIEHILAGGDSGPVLPTGDAPASSMLRRVLLPVEDDDHMPPDGKPQPTPVEIELIQTWIQASQQTE